MTNPYNTHTGQVPAAPPAPPPPSPGLISKDYLVLWIIGAVAVLALAYYLGYQVGQDSWQDALRDAIQNGGQK